MQLQQHGQLHVQKSPLKLTPNQQHPASPSTVLPKLKIPEQAHTPNIHSPTSSRKVSNDLLSPMEQSSQHRQQPQQHHQIEQQHNQLTNSSLLSDRNYMHVPQQHAPVEKSKIGSIFRRFSQNKPEEEEAYSTATPTGGQAYASSAKTGNTAGGENKKVWRKTHQRTVSEYVPPSRIHSYGATPTTTTTKTTTGQPPVIDLNTNVPLQSSTLNTSAFPALPANADELVKQQRMKEMNKKDDLKLDNVTNNSTSSEFVNPNNNPVFTTGPAQNGEQPRTVTRRMHPSARAKSVGHVRKESLTFLRPSSGGSNAPSGPNDTPKLAPPAQSTAASANPAPATNEISKQNTHQHYDENSAVGGNDKATTHFYKKMTEDEILEEASKAPMGTMPSIDYPRTLFLKGFFSVQTTSSKPLPIVRYEIISTLTKMNIQFKEVKGGFECVYKNQNTSMLNSSKVTKPTGSKTPHNYENQTPLATSTVSDDENDDYDTDDRELDYITDAYAYSNNDAESGSFVRKNSDEDTGKQNVSRHGSVVKSNYKSQIPATPKASANAQNYMAFRSPLPAQHQQHIRQVSGVDELSTASLKEDEANQLHNMDGLLTTNSAGDGAHSSDASQPEQLQFSSEPASTNNTATGVSDVDQKHAFNIAEVTDVENEFKTVADAADSISKSPIKFEIHIVKVRIIGLAGVHFKKVSGNTWIYKKLATHILKDLKL
ncbi:hypothetical protein ACO0RG_002523 [Hanseniaspora osmophila]